MKQTVLELTRKRRLSADVWELCFAGDLSGVKRPGQFVNLSIPGRFLRRPISVCAWTPDTLTLLVKIAGEGTRELIHSPPGARFDALTGLGNGFSFTESALQIVLVGGGIGLAPLYGLAECLNRSGVKPVVAMGFRSADDVFYTDRFAALECGILIATEDGSQGVRGFVTDLLRSIPEPIYLYVCGPLPMLKAVYRAYPCGGQFSLEARMGCGFGACMGCSIPTVHGYRRVCVDGPVFHREELLWTNQL